MREATDGGALEFLGVEAEQSAEGAVAVTEAAVGVGEGNADWRMLDGIAEQCLHRPQLARYPEESGDIGALALNVYGACSLHSAAPSPAQATLA